MPEDFKINVEADLDTSKAEKKLADLTKDKKKVKIEVDASDINKSTDKLKDKNVKVKAKVDGTKDVQSLTQGLNETQKATDKLKNSFSGIAKIGAQIDVFRMIKQEAQDAVQAVKEIDDAIVSLQMATSESYSSIKTLVSGYNDMAKQLGATTTEVTSAADDYLRQGKSISDTNNSIKNSMILSKVANIDSSEATTYLTAMQKGFHKTEEEVSSLNDALTSIDLEAAVDAGGLAEATSRVAASADLAGVSVNKLLGYEAAVGEASQESMSVIGNSFKTIFSRMSDIKSGKLELIDEDGTSQTLSDVETVLKNAKIELRESDNEFRDFGSVLDDVASKWNNFSSVQKAAISKAFAGQRQMNRFQLLMENYGKALEYTNIANNSKGTAEKKFEDGYLNSLEAKQKSLQASFESLATNTISRDTYSGIIEATQALVEFLDKTQLVKGAMAGLAVNGAVKGFVSLTTGLTQAAMKMQDFQKALNLLKAGNIGEDSVQKLASYTDGLTKSQTKAILSSTELSNAQRLQILTASGMSEAEANAAISAMGLSTANEGATASTLSLGTAMKGLWSTMLANPLILLTAGVTAAVTAYSAYKQSIEDALQAESESGQKFIENTQSIQENIDKVKELRESLASGTLSEEEAYQAKSDLLSIQNQLSESYGEQADGIDLVNGKLDEQISKMNELAVTQANDYLNDNGKIIDKAQEEMSKKRDYKFGDYALDNTTYKDELNSISKEFDHIGLQKKSDGTYSLKFTGDASEADEEINGFMTKLRELKDSLGDDVNTVAIDSIINQGESILNDNQEILEKYQEASERGLKASMISKGYSENSPATIYNEYEKAIDKYN